MGIIGAGNIATLNVPGYLTHEQCDVVAICDPRPDVLERRQNEWNVKVGYTEVGDLLADGDVDAVEILSPTPLHAEHTIAALEAGKHVSCQKPIANNVAEARRMVAVAAQSGRTFRVTEQCCHYPPLRKARDLLRQQFVPELPVESPGKFLRDLRRAAAVFPFDGDDSDHAAPIFVRCERRI